MNAPLDPERLRGLFAKMQRVQFLREREAYEESLSQFVRGAWPSIDSAEYQESWAIDALCDHLEAVTLGQIPRLLINFPPRCSKTSVTSVCWPAWTWARREESYWSGPKVKFLCASYGSTLSWNISNTTRRLLNSPWYQEYWGERVQVTDDQDAKVRFDLVAGGNRQATSVGGSLLGLGGDLVIIDDPHNTETEKVVETDADRNKVASWWKEISSTRLNSPKQSAIVVVMQRLHQHDLSGVILDDDSEDWVHLMIPMRHDPARHCVTIKLPQYEEEEPWEDPRTEEDELMWPERFGEPEVARLESRLGPYMASGRLQQSPVPKGGGIIQRAWWTLWDQTEAQKYGLEWTPERKEFPHFDLVVGSLDTNYGEKEENDFNAYTVWGLWQDKAKNRRAMLCYAWAKRLKLNGQVLEQRVGETNVMFRQRQQQEWGLIEWIADTNKRYRVRRMLIENKSRGPDVANEIKRQYARERWGVQLIDPVGDKVSRTHAIVPLFTDKGIWAPDTRWAESVISQCEIFPKGEHDDLVDTVTQFLSWSRDNELLVRGEEMSAALDEEAAYQAPKRSIAETYGV